MKTRTLTLPARIPEKLRLAVCADFHSANREMHIDRTLERLRAASPDFILCPGDFFNYSDEFSVRDWSNRHALEFLAGAAVLAPTFFSLGNHDRGLSPENRRILEDAGVTPLTDEFTRRGPLVIGALSSPGPIGRHKLRAEDLPSGAFLDGFARESGYHVLLCHHPEFWEPMVCGRGIELTVAGHAHGGQWRIFGQGVYAPGQGMFPRYTSGLYRKNAAEVLAVSRGMTNSMPLIPRFFNPTEILTLDLIPEADA
ncbi:MAG: metallophosphoesterase [Clostridia bacterium]|nr:metallophosphoesterase [Clostridia bacterium]